jgi:micrococcal nuclease
MMVLLLLALAACGGPNAKDLEKGETGKVAAVKAGDLLVLDSGLQVRLTGIEAPHRGWPMADEARTALTDLAMGREVALYYGGARRLAKRAKPAADAADAAEAAPPVAAAAPDDPTAPALAQVYVKTETGRWVWLQEAMIQAGMARAHSWRDNNARASALLAAEGAARQAKLGVWATPAFAVHSPESAASALEACAAANRRSCYQIVEGRVLAARDSKGRTYLNFGTDPMTDFTIALDAETAAAWPGGAGALAGHRVRARGYLSDRGGPLMRVDHIAQIEDLGAG